MTPDPLRILLNFDRWATESIIDACRPLRDEQLDQPFDIGLGSLRRTLDHLVSNMQYWMDGAECREPRRYSPEPTMPLEAIAERYARVWAEYAAMIEAEDRARINEVIVDRFKHPSGQPATLRFTRSSVLLHVFNHGTHHRVQCLYLLKRLGVNPLPEIDLIDSHQELEIHHA